MAIWLSVQPAVTGKLGELFLNGAAEDEAVIPKGRERSTPDSLPAPSARAPRTSVVPVPALSRVAKGALLRLQGR